MGVSGRCATKRGGRHRCGGLRHSTASAPGTAVAAVHKSVLAAAGSEVALRSAVAVAPAPLLVFGAGGAGASG